jgi:hypothetical protein
MFFRVKLIENDAVGNCTTFFIIRVVLIADSTVALYTVHCNN